MLNVFLLGMHPAVPDKLFEVLGRWPTNTGSLKAAWHKDLCGHKAAAHGNTCVQTHESVPGQRHCWCFVSLELKPPSSVGPRHNALHYGSKGCD